MAGKKAKTPAKIHTLFLYTGYAEDGSNACLVAYNKKGFDSVADALKDFACKIIEHNMVDLEEESERKTCSHKFGLKDQFCPKCGAPRKKDSAELPEQAVVESWMNHFIHGGGDGSGYLWNHLYRSGWTCGSQAVSKKSLSSGVVLVRDNAEQLLYIVHTHTGNIETLEKYLLSRPEEPIQIIC